jgi:hypothetical protein
MRDKPFTLDDVLGMTAKDIIAMGEDYNPSDFEDDALSAIQLAWELIHEARGDYEEVYK